MLLVPVGEWWRSGLSHGSEVAQKAELAVAAHRVHSHQLAQEWQFSRACWVWTILCKGGTSHMHLNRLTWALHFITYVCMHLQKCITQRFSHSSINLHILAFKHAVHQKHLYTYLHIYTCWNERDNTKGEPHHTYHYSCMRGANSRSATRRGQLRHVCLQ